MILRLICMISIALLLSLLVLLKPAVAVAPPHPSWKDWESVHQMRKRLNITYNYKPEHVQEEHCRYLTEEQCREDDEGLGHAAAGRHGRHLSPSVGNRLRILVVLLRFKDHVDRVLPPREYFEEMFNGNTGNTLSNVNPVGSVKEYFRYSSLGKYRVQFDVRDWHTAPNTEAFYAQGVSGLVGQVKLQEMFYTAMDEIEASGIDWFDGYINAWGLLNHVVVIHSGYAAEHGPRPCLQSEPPQNRIWSQGSASSQTGWLSRDYFQVNGYAVGSAFGIPKCNGDTTSAPNAGMGVIVHEYLHGFKLKDLYDMDTDDKRLVIGGTGRFDIMSNAYGWDRNDNIPGHMSPFSRMSTPGWLEPIEIVRDGFYAIQPSEISSHIYKISHNFPEGEYLLIENRQPIKWDENWPACGMVIYHVDEKVKKQDQRGYPGKAGFPQQHYLVSVLQADGNYDIEKGVNFGDEGDCWKKGDVLGPGSRLGSTTTWPNTDSIQDGIHKETGLTILIKSSPGFIMTFQVDGINGNKVGRARPSTIGEPDVEFNEPPDTTGKVLAWILSLLGGIGAMVGMVVLAL